MWVDPCFDFDSAGENELSEARFVLVSHGYHSNRSRIRLNVCNSVISGTIGVRTPCLPLGTVVPEITIDDCDISGNIIIDLFGWAQKCSFVRLSALVQSGSTRISIHSMGQEGDVGVVLNRSRISGDLWLKVAATKMEGGGYRGVDMSGNSFSGRNVISLERKVSGRGVSLEVRGCSFRNAGFTQITHSQGPHNFVMPKFDLRQL